MVEMINPKLQYCRCGYYFKPSVFMKIVMLIKGRYIWTCPQCRAELELVLVNHVVCVKRKENMDKEIWKNG